MTHLPRHHIDLVGSSAGAAEARAMVRRAADDAGLDQLADDAELVAAELVANAFLHAGGPCSVTVTAAGSVLRIEVRDGSPLLPSPGMTDTTASTGRGLLLVAGLTERWGATGDRRGKTVWAELDGSAAPAVPADLTAEDLLAFWAGREPARPTEPALTVPGVPTQIMCQVKSHVEALRRELALVLAEPDHADPEVVAVARAVADTADAFASTRAEIRRQSLAAAASGSDRFDLVLDVGPGTADAALAYLDALDAAERLAAAGRLLAVESRPDFAAFRRWYLGEVASRARRAHVDGG